MDVCNAVFYNVLVFLFHFWLRSPSSTTSRLALPLGLHDIIYAEEYSRRLSPKLAFFYSGC
jgi:hypothetical protein